MTTAAQAIDSPPTRQPSWSQLVRDELAPTPGRVNATIRIVVASLIVLVTSMTLEVPFIAISIFIVLYLTMLTSVVTAQNSVAVAIAGTMALVVATSARAAERGAALVDVDYQPLPAVLDERWIRALHVETMREEELHEEREPHVLFQASTIAASSRSPDALTMAAGVAPNRSSRAAITATSATPGMRLITASISTGETLIPPVMIRSFRRSRNLMRP